MNSKERVKRTTEFKVPDRLPLFHTVLPNALLKYGKNLLKILKKYPQDFGSSSYSVPKACDKHEYRNTYIDRWGCRWEETLEGILGQVKGHPLSNWDRAENFSIPSIPPTNELAKLVDTEEKCYILGFRPPEKPSHQGGFTLFQRMFWLRGFSTLLKDIQRHPQRVRWLRNKVLSYNKEVLLKTLEAGVDGIFFADDWGTQNNLFINPALWRKVFKPAYREMFNLVHEYGKHVFFHSDGYIVPIIPDLIEIGVDVLNPQFSCMKLEQLSSLTQGKVCILTDLDRQYLLPFGSPVEIEEYIETVVNMFSTPEGGVILRGEIDAQVPLENVEAMFACFEKYSQRFKEV